MNQRARAKAVLKDAGIPVGQDFDSLIEAQICAVIDEAKAAYQSKYGRSMPPDSGNYIRKRYELLQLRAAS
jgi:hypothetical protein